MDPNELERKQPCVDAVDCVVTSPSDAAGRPLCRVREALAAICVLDLVVGGAWLYVTSGDSLPGAIVASVAVLTLCGWLAVDEFLDRGSC